ncbi:MAG: hypothetical protein JW751_02810 [Polyangiaceae bacterium]|nr:hypothetical protein [Polyangiaceae bacterium]
MADAPSEGTKFQSKLKTGRERFLAHVIEHSLEIELRTAADFIRHFPPAVIMKGLTDQPEIRAQILVLTTGTKHKIAARKSAESSGEDLQIALDEGETDPDSIVAIFDPDDRVRYLDAERLWSFCIEGDFWKLGSPNPTETDRARQQVAFVIERALTDALITHRDVVEAIGVAELASRLPRAELAKLIERALETGHRKAPFTDADLLTTSPLSEIVRHVPLPHLWDTVIANRIAERHGFVSPTPRPFNASEWPGTDEVPVEAPTQDGSAKRPASGPGGEKTAGAQRASLRTRSAGTNANEEPGGARRPMDDGDDEAPIIESLPPDPDAVTDDDIRLT